MADKELKTLDDVIAEQNRLMAGNPIEKTKEEWEGLDREMNEIIRKNKEKKVQTA